MEKKKEREQLASQEDREIQAQAAKKGGQSQKMSRAQIREEAERREAVARGRAAGKPIFSPYFTLSFNPRLLKRTPKFYFIGISY